MKAHKVWTAIAGAGVVASITAACGYFPDIKFILTASSGLVSAIVSYVIARE